MAAGLTLMYEPRTEGKIHSADPLNLNQKVMGKKKQKTNRKSLKTK